MSALVTVAVFTQVCFLGSGFSTSQHEAQACTDNCGRMMRAEHGGVHDGWSSSPLVAHAYFINLDVSVKRRQFAQDQLESLKRSCAWQFDFDRIPAVNKSHPLVLAKMQNGSAVEKEMLDDLHDDERNGTIACYTSHLLAWKKALADVTTSHHTSEFVMIMEDDAELHFSTFDELATKLSIVPHDADMVLLGSFGSRRPSDIAASAYTGSDDAEATILYRASGPFGPRVNSEEDAKAVNDSNHSEDRLTQLHPTVFYGGMHAYLLRTNRLPQLILHLEQDKTSWNVDAGTPWDASSCRKYVLYPPVVTQAELGYTRQVVKNVTHT